MDQRKKTVVRLLLVEDSPLDAEMAVRELRKAGWDVESRRVDNEAALRAALAEERWDVVVSDFRLPGFGGLEALAVVKRHAPGLPFILVSGIMGEEAAVEAMRAGARDYVLKEKLYRLEPAIRRELEETAEHARQEEALRESEDRYHRLADAASDLIVLHCCWGRILYANRTAREAFGLDSEAPAEANLGDYVMEGCKDSFSAILDRCRQGIQSKELFSLRLRTAGGRVMNLETKLTPMPHASNRQAVLMVGRDITDREALQAQLQQAQKLESIGRLAGGVAHDMNNMLSVILGHVDLGAMELAPHHPMQNRLRKIEEAASRAAGLTRQLLTFARKQPVSPRRIDLNESLPALVDMLRHLITEEVLLNWEPGPDLWPIEVDPSQVDQILTNLVVNARDAVGQNGKISISTANKLIDTATAGRFQGASAGEYVCLSVKDNGCGMTREMLEHIFEPFYTTKGSGKGTGLGLAMVYGAVSQNRGFITVESAAGEGTAMKVFFPRTHAGPVSENQASAPKKLPEGSQVILVTEDEESILALIGAILRRCGYKVLLASHPLAAIRIAKTNRIDMLVTDVIMPEMNGKQLRDRLMAENPNLRTLFVSGYPESIVENDGAIGNGLSFLQKPFTAIQLSQAVDEVFRTAWSQGGGES